MAKINNMIELISRLDGERITVHQERCAMVRNRNADCLKCAEVCTSRCLDFDGSQLTIAPDRCIGCGTCATVCPTCALESHFPNDDELLGLCRKSAAENEGKVVIVCGTIADAAAGLYDAEKAVRVECLGRVEETLLTMLAAEHAAEVVLVHGRCEQCEHVAGRHMAELVCETQHQLLDAWNNDMTVRFAEKMPSYVKVAESAYDKAKRADLAQSARTASALVDDVASSALVGTSAGSRTDAAPLKVMADGTLPHFIPDRRERLLDALAAMGMPDDVMIDTRLWGHVIIDAQACSSCRMCATFCPTGALRKFDREDGTMGVEHYPGDCVKCRTCTAICPEGALSLSEEVFARDMLAGMVDSYEMEPPAVQRGGAHTIWNLAKGMSKTTQIFER